MGERLDFGEYLFQNRWFWGREGLQVGGKPLKTSENLRFFKVPQVFDSKYMYFKIIIIFIYNVSLLEV
jgi:hypothetical protein